MEEGRIKCNRTDFSDANFWIPGYRYMPYMTCVVTGYSYACMIVRTPRVVTGTRASTT